jgi:hypothetical protein
MWGGAWRGCGIWLGARRSIKEATWLWGLKCAKPHERAVVGWAELGDSEVANQAVSSTVQFFVVVFCRSDWNDALVNMAGTFRLNVRRVWKQGRRSLRTGVQVWGEGPPVRGKVVEGNRTGFESEIWDEGQGTEILGTPVLKSKCLYGGLCLETEVYYVTPPSWRLKMKNTY